MEHGADKEIGDPEEESSNSPKASGTASATRRRAAIAPRIARRTAPSSGLTVFVSQA